MSIFGPSTMTDEQANELSDEISSLSKRLDKLVGTLESRSLEIEASRELDTIKRDLTTKQIEWDREKEKWDREKRDVEHMVGLQKKRAEQERDLAVKAAQLEVREGNLSAKEDVFEERLEKITEGMEAQIKYLRKDIIEQLLTRLPTFDVKTALEPHRLLAQARNGHSNGDEDE